MSHIYCPECGFQSPEAATYCSRCGALLVRETVGETTLSLGPDDLDRLPTAESIDGPALVVRSGGGRAGESFEAIGDRALIGRSPECDVFLDDVTVSRRHAELVRDGERVHDSRPRQPQRDVRQQAADREQRARGRRRGPDRQVPDDVPAPMTTVPETSPTADLHTIGAVCERLRDEFPDISISKIRYLEDQGLLQPSRTRGGYRLFAEADVERLITILRLQRDEFLPLRVIREELMSPTADRAKRRGAGLRGQEEEIDMSELCERAGISADFARQLEDFSLLAPRIEGGERLYSESEADIALACARIARHGIDARHLRAFRTAAGRQSALLEQVVAPALRSRNLERRAAALEDLESLAVVAQELAQLLLMRDLREVAER